LKDAKLWAGNYKYIFIVVSWFKFMKDHPSKLVDSIDGKPVIYSDIWDFEKTSAYERLLIAPANKHVELMIDLAEKWGGLYRLLYVMIVSRHEKYPEGRYQCPKQIEFHDATYFLRKYSNLFENDGRHHIWLASDDNKSQLIYDRHNVIYAYGDIEMYNNVLTEKGFRKNKVLFPFIHSHHFNKDNDIFVEQLMNEWEWIHFPLRDSDR